MSTVDKGAKGVYSYPTLVQEDSSMEKRNRFARGSGVYQCRICKRQTRLTGDASAADANMCDDDWELAGIYNAYQDEGINGITDYADEIRARTANIVAKGGTLDGDAQELLNAIAD